MLIGCYLIKKSSEVSIKTRSPPASFSFKIQATKHIAVKINEQRGLVSKETVVLHRWGSDTRKFGLSTELILSLIHI